MKWSTNIFYTMSLVLMFFVTGCGGGGDDSSSTPTPIPTPIDESNLTVARTLSVAPLTDDSTVTVASGYFALKDDAPVNEALVPYFQGDVNGTYVTDILQDASIKFTVDVPDDPATYGSYAGTQLTYVGFIFYPTKYDANYSASQTISGWEHPSTYTQMESSVDATPIFKDENVKYPLLVQSHGSNGEIVTAGHLIKTFASHEYVVVSLFYGDTRFSNDSNEVTTLRPLAAKKVIDFLENSKYADHIDFTKIGAFGNSFGGTTSFMLIGAKPIDVVTKDGNVVANTVEDSRIVVAGGIEPYMGDESGIYPKINNTQVTFFGYDSRGATSLNAPYLAVSGSNDTVAAESFTKIVLEKLPKNNHLVSMEGETHDMTADGAKTADTWVYYFLNYSLKGDDTFLKMKEVSGDPVDTYIYLENE